MTDSSQASLVPLESERGIDYIPLQQLLIEQDFEAADQMTRELLCRLGGAASEARKWLYFSEVRNIPVKDLRTIDQLWVTHSNGKFGFSIQRKLWLGVSKNWEKLWPKMGWKTGNSWTRFPKQFTWSLDAPKGHLPLSNQLRGVRLIDELFAHPAWDESQS
ncbi:MAG: GUN4 domain-containing protein [Oscillatoriales cyanobacterium]|jgi:GUN4-like|nr:MAG: GUN4 domain-containing protein [Oscillatoriales cyanobacterium]